MAKVLLDMNNPNFQEQLFTLETLEQRALLNTLNKIIRLSWEELYNHTGIRWKLIASENTPKGSNLYSFRFSRKYRGTAYRKGNYLTLVGLFVDHDSAYI
jgi:hypothetical protein